MSKTVAFIQARASSSRLPGKVLADLNGRPLILFMVDRVRRARRLDQIVVVTSTHPSDDALAQLLEANGIAIFRGSLEDVLDRFGGAAEVYDPSVIVRLTGDCPLIDPQLIDQVVAQLHDSGADYASNVDPPTYPDGMDVEAFTRATLLQADHRATSRAQREHVTVFMRDAGTAIRRVATTGLFDASHIRLTVDYTDDLQVVRRIVQLIGNDCDFDLFDIYRCLEQNPDIQGSNLHERNEGLRNSLLAD